MKISLQIIVEKLNLRTNEAVLLAPHQSVFADVRLLSPELTVLESEILYVGEGLLGNTLVCEPNCGLCLLGSSDTFPCDTLLISGQHALFELFNRISQLFYEIRIQFEKLTQAILQKKGLQGM